MLKLPLWQLYDLVELASQIFLHELALREAGPQLMLGPENKRERFKIKEHARCKQISKLVSSDLSGRIKFLHFTFCQALQSVTSEIVKNVPMETNCMYGKRLLKLIRVSQMCARNNRVNC